MTSTELKAQAYDIIAAIEQHQNAIEGLKQHLQGINQQIMQAVQAEQKPIEAQVSEPTAQADIAQEVPEAVGEVLAAAAENGG